MSSEERTEKSVIQFSGGRTSGFMLDGLLSQHGGKLPDGFRICFENTGKEREETLEFVEEVSQRWGVEITWLEFDDCFNIAEYTKPDGTLRKKKNRENRFRVVDFSSASRNGEPFLKVMRQMREYRAAIKGLGPIMPNPAQRMCTAHMKIKIVASYLHSLGWTEWITYMGIRADEAGRAAKMRANLPRYETLITPLIEMGTKKEDVNAFWRTQPFDLKLDANSDQGNCDLCFLKATGKLITIMRADRSREEWWKAAEIEFGGTFSKGKPSFHKLAAMIDCNDPGLDKYVRNPIDKTLDCFCGD